MYSREVNEDSYLSHNGGGEGTSVIHPAVHTGFHVQLSHVAEGPIQVRNCPWGWLKRRHLSGLRFESSGMETLRRASGLRAPVSLAESVSLSKMWTQGRLRWSSPVGCEGWLWSWRHKGKPSEGSGISPGLQLDPGGPERPSRLSRWPLRRGKMTIQESSKEKIFPGAMSHYVCVDPDYTFFSIGHVSPLKLGHRSCFSKLLEGQEGSWFH